MKRAPCCAVKGDVDACEFRPRRGFPDKTDAATNRRWVTADTPPATTSSAGENEIELGQRASRALRAIKNILESQS